MIADEHFPLRGGTACQCGWDFGLSLNDTRSNMKLWIAHFERVVRDEAYDEIRELQEREGL